MAHFAKLDNKNKIVAVHPIANGVITDSDGNEQEQLGIDFLTQMYGNKLWVQTSYNGNFRKNYAGVGFTYDKTRDAFIAPQPYPSWTLNEDTCQYEAPVAYPDDGKYYEWDEETTNWTEIE